MKRTSGTALVESTLSISIVLSILFLMIQLTCLFVSRQIVQWACFSVTRKMLPKTEYGHHKEEALALKEGYAILRHIPLQKSTPLIMTRRSHHSQNVVTAYIRQPVTLLGTKYVFEETFSLHR